MPEEQIASLEPSQEAPIPDELNAADVGDELEGAEALDAETEQPESDVAEEGQPEEKKGRTAKYIDKLKQERTETLADRDEWRRFALKLQEQVAPKPTAPELPEQTIEPDMSDVPKPKWEDFQTEEEYQDARVAWQAEKVYRQKELKRYQVAIREEQRQEKTRFEGWLGEAEAKYQDFRNVALKPYEAGGPAITLEMDAAIRSDPLGADIAYHLGRNPRESERIAAMKPLDQIREIGKLSAKLENQSIKPKPRTQSSAPAPTRGPSTSAETPRKDPTKMSFSEYTAWREGGGGR